VERLKGELKPETRQAIARLYRPVMDNGDGDGNEAQPRLTAIMSTLSRLATMADSADAAPTTQVRTAAEETLKRLDEVIEEWKKLR
jgi:hypothetical protein